MTDAGQTADASPEPARPSRYRLNRAGVHNVWQYDDHVFQFADGRLLLRGRNGAGKSKALEMLLPFLLDGDSRRLDTTGTSRTSLRWLMLEGRSAPEADGGADEGDETAPDTVLGYLWVEFTGRGDGGEQRWRTLGAAITASVSAAEARSVLFVTERRVGTDLDLVTDGRPLSIERLRAEVGPDNCYDTAVAYRTRVMRELFGLDDPVRYRNLVHLLYRLRRPTIGERLEAGELVSVLAEALPPMDEAVLDEVARNITDLDSARARLTALRAARDQVEDFLGDYRRYLHGALRGQAGAVREQIEAYARRDAEVARLETELDTLVATESAVQEERDRLRRTRDTAASDAATLDAGDPGGPAPADSEQQARYAAVTAYIRAAEAAWAAAGHALTTERHAEERLAADIAAIDRRLAGLQQLHAQTSASARASGIGTAALGEVPEPVPTTLAPRESVTRVNLEGLEQAVEREPVSGVDLAALRSRLAGLHDRLGHADDRAAEREHTVEALHGRALALEAAERRETALADEAEWGDGHVERARERERTAIEAVRAASADYAARVREWCGSLRSAAPTEDLADPLDALEQRVELPLDDALRVVDAETPAEIVRDAHAVVDPLLEELRARRDTALGEERELAAELDELSERKAGGIDHVAAPPQPWATAPRDPAAGAPFYLAVDFADGLGAAERAGLEAALEAGGLLSGWLTADGAVIDPATRDLLLSPGEPVGGRTLLDVLKPVGPPGSGIDSGAVTALLTSVRLEPSHTGEPPRTGEEPGARLHGGGTTRPAESSVGLDGRWRLGVASGSHRKAAPEYIGEAARAETRERHRAKIDRRIAIAEALLAEAGERRGDIERRHETLVGIARSVPSAAGLIAAWAALDNAREWLAAANRDHAAARRAAETARATTLELRADLTGPAQEHALPTGREELAAVRTALGLLRVRIAAAHRDLEVLAGLLEDYRLHAGEWERARADRVAAEDAGTAAIGDMITVRRETELTDRARAAAPEQIETAVTEVRARARAADDGLPELERAARGARDDRIAAETRHDTALRERAEQAHRALAVGAALRAMLADADGGVDTALLDAAGLAALAGDEGPVADHDAAEAAEDGAGELAKRVQTLDALVTAVETGLDPDPEADVDNSGILRRREELHRLLAASDTAGARTELTEPAGVKRVTVHDDDGSHDITAYAQRLRRAITEAEETAAVREEEAYERHLLGELAGHLSRQINEARALISTMNEVFGEVTTSQGLGVRLDWRLAPDADEDISAVVPLLDRPAENRTRVETTRLRDALRRCIEAIRRLDPTATGGAQLRAALDYRSWFAFSVYVTDAAHPERERRLTHRTALSQGEQRVIAYLVLFAAAAAQFGALAEHAPHAPRLILLDDAFAKVDEPTHGRLLGLLVELDLDFVLTSERLWGCFSSVPSLHIYECLRDPAEPGIATLHFTWDGTRRRLVGV
ncbi:uncharacterized protein (TIGR02680 family) [Spinactinospora alkalitolerans]|uniref:Uncharacterized protein (TIGR02680 family) n=1 Tax=Spinactinospora alkalitolerans TaxID=687207 RepID=A0A852U719_9ACTN|nr:TIGR02680 family protein [Spinactinospora alkalitolerans]NYE49874.1 uncharacterized protein (TIGR02680 family) [Spinactinospora alkalitolerans]